MAGLWTGSAINTNETAKVFNQLSDKKSLPMIVKLNGLLYAMSGKNDPQNQSVGAVMKSSKITGNKVEVPLLGVLDAPAAISDGSGEVASASITYTSADYGAAEFAIAHYGLVRGIPDSELMRFKGDEAKTLSYIDDRHDHLMWSYEDVLGNALHANTAPSRSAFGGWVYAVADDNTYGTIDRTDSGNADFRGIVASSFGDTTLSKLQAQKNTARVNLGNPSICVAGTTLFNKIQSQVQGYSQVSYSNSKAEFGADDWVWAGMRGLLDQRTASGTIGLIDPRWWLLIQNDMPFTDTGIIRDITKKATHIIHTTLWIQNICKKPNAQVKITGAT
jgi:hypothetical protein